MLALHTKKTNNTNMLMQISYHYVLTKIQKLQNLKKKTFFCTGRYGMVRYGIDNLGPTALSLTASPSPHSLKTPTLTTTASPCQWRL